MKSIAHVGMDVHAGQFRIAILPDTGSEFLDEFTVRRDRDCLLKCLRRWQGDYQLQCYYEAGCLGYSPYRWLASAGIACTVVPPALVPRAPGDRVRTDPKDARRLAQQGRAGALPGVYVPTPEQEAVRSIVRWRMSELHDLQAARQRVQGFLLSRGLHYEAGKKLWTQQYWAWLRALVGTGEGLQPLEQDLLAQRLGAVQYAETRLAEAGKVVGEVATGPEYAQLLGKLCCFRGIDVVAAMVIVSETIDFRRFPSAGQYMGYWGLTSSEESSGTHRRQGAITKCGAEHVRWILIQAAWHYRHRPALGENLRRRQAGQPPAVIAHAWKAQCRLHRKFMKLVMRKGAKKAVVATARELSGFLWAAATQ